MMTGSQHARKVASWARKVAAADKQRQAAVAGRDAAIVAMRADGATLQAIADAAGLSHVAIMQILARMASAATPETAD